MSEPCAVGVHNNPFLAAVSKVVRKRRPRLNRREPFLVRTEDVPGGIMAQIWFITAGCTWDACTMCDYGAGPRTGVSEMVGAVKQGLHALADTELAYLEVAPSGSMLDPIEVPDPARRMIFEAMRDSGVPNVIIESRAETFDDERVAELRAAFPKQRVGTMIGLESAHPGVQRFCINKGSRAHWFGDTAERLSQNEIELFANVSLGSAFLNPHEALQDAVDAVRWSLSNGAGWAVLYPLHVKDHTLTAQLFRLGLYQPSSLWALIEALHQLGPELAERTSIAWHRNYFGVPFLHTATTCPSCCEEVLAILDEYRARQSWDVIERAHALRCDCRDLWSRDVERARQPTPLHERVAEAYTRLAEMMELEGLWEELKPELLPQMREELGDSLASER